MRNTLFLLAGFLIPVILILGFCFWLRPARPDFTIGLPDEFRVVTIEGCEYIEREQGAGGHGHVYSLTHKGNCKNPIHRHEDHQAR